MNDAVILETCGLSGGPDGSSEAVQRAAMGLVMEQKKLIRCSCGSPFDFTFLRQCAECRKPLCFECAKLFRGSRYCKPHRKARADAASKEDKS
jgi:hypothetical protein